MADAVCEGRDTLPLFGKELPSILFKLWWIAQFALTLVPSVGGLLGIAVSVIFFGTVLSECYARIEGKSVKETQVIGFISGWIKLIAIIKFLSYRKDTRLG